MKASVNKKYCIGCGRCVLMCPEVFKKQEGKSVTKCDEVPLEITERAVRAKKNCPTNAISLT